MWMIKNANDSLDKKEGKSGINQNMISNANNIVKNNKSSNVGNCVSVCLSKDRNRCSNRLSVGSVYP